MMFEPYFMPRSDTLQAQFRKFVELIKITKQNQQLSLQDEVVLPMNAVISTIGVNSIEQVDQWLGEHPELCAFIHNGDVYVSRCDI
jgi:hypothetical protein